MVNAALRKIKVDGDGAGDEEAADETTPKAKTKSGGKRKSVAGMQEETPKKRGRKSKKDDQDSPIPGKVLRLTNEWNATLMSNRSGGCQRHDQDRGGG